MNAVNPDAHKLHRHDGDAFKLSLRTRSISRNYRCSATGRRTRQVPERTGFPQRAELRASQQKCLRSAPRESNSFWSLYVGGSQRTDNSSGAQKGVQIICYRVALHYPDKNASYLFPGPSEQASDLRFDMGSGRRAHPCSCATANRQSVRC